MKSLVAPLRPQELSTFLQGLGSRSSSSLAPLQPPRSPCCSLHHLCAGRSFSLVLSTHTPQALTHLSSPTNFHLLFPRSAQTSFLWEVFPDTAFSPTSPGRPVLPSFLHGTLPPCSALNPHGAAQLWRRAGWGEHVLSEAVNTEGTQSPCPCPPWFTFPSSPAAATHLSSLHSGTSSL